MTLGWVDLWILAMLLYPSMRCSRRNRSRLSGETWPWRTIFTAQVTACYQANCACWQLSPYRRVSALLPLGLFYPFSRAAILVTILSADSRQIAGRRMSQSGSLTTAFRPARSLRSPHGQNVSRSLLSISMMRIA